MKKLNKNIDPNGPVQQKQKQANESILTTIVAVATASNEATEALNNLSQAIHQIIEVLLMFT